MTSEACGTSAGSAIMNRQRSGSDPPVGSYLYLLHVEDVE